MRTSTAGIPRGRDLEGDELKRAFADRTIVRRYRRTPTGERADYVVYEYFLADGRFAVVENWTRPPLPVEALEGDYWSVSGPRLCYRHARHYPEPRCFRVTEGRGGELQFYLDKPGSEFDGLLESIEVEILQGPPPASR